MAKQNKFTQLGKGNEDLLSGLDILNSGSEVKSFNPLVDVKKGKSKKQVATPSKTKPKQLAKKLHEPKPDIDTLEKEKEVKIPEVKLPKSNPESKSVKKATTRVGERVKNIAKEPTLQQDHPDDFITHSALFSAAQLNMLRQAVYLKKANENPRYTIKDALHASFDLLMTGRKECHEFPEDFKTYTAKISESQLADLKTFVFQIKGGGELKYSLMRAVYEAIGMYLELNSK